MKPKICLYLRDDLADVYAFANLYEFLIKNDFQAEFRTNSINVHFGNLRDCLNTVVNESSNGLVSPIKEFELCDADEWSGLVLKGYCDVLSSMDLLSNQDIAIDHSILKNCAKPISEQKRISLRQKYGIPNDESVAVIGFPSNIASDEVHCALDEVVDAFYREVRFYAVGSINMRYAETMQNKHSINFVEKFGVLKDYYALADVVITNSNICQYSPMNMHNFVEATAGGPLFLINPEKVGQYGYKELKDLGVIRESINTQELISGMRDYLQSPDGENIRALRAQHLEKSRELYLPDLMRVFNRVLGLSEEPFESDLLVEIVRPNCLTALRIVHPDTFWEFSLPTNRAPLKEAPESWFKRVRGGE
ncbi:MAG: hypothetical protein AABX39_05895 [Nanoarchaeota archaeon]